MTVAIRHRLFDTADILSDLDTLLEAASDRLPALTLARVLIELDDTAVRLTRLRQRLNDAAANPSGCSGCKNATDAG